MAALTVSSRKRPRTSDDPVAMQFVVGASGTRQLTFGTPVHAHAAPGVAALVAASARVFGVDSIVIGDGACIESDDARDKLPTIIFGVDQCGKIVSEADEGLYDRPPPLFDLDGLGLSDASEGDAENAPPCVPLVSRTLRVAPSGPFFVEMLSGKEPTLDVEPSSTIEDATAALQD